MQLQFGVGTVIGKRVDLANRPNMFFGVTEAWSCDFSQELVSLLGQYKVPVDVAPGELKITGKIKFARLQATALGDYLLGVTPASASGFSITGPENKTNVAATTFVVTGGTTFLEDLGVFYHNTGVSLFPTTATPAAGVYIAGAAAGGNSTLASGQSSNPRGPGLFYFW